MEIREFAKDIRIRSQQFSDVVCACRSLFEHSPIAAQARAHMRARMSNYSIKKFGIGYFPDNKNLDELIELVDKDVLTSLKLVRYGTINNRSHIDRYRCGFFDKNNIIFPFKDEYGNIIALAGRTLLSEKERKEQKVSKYKNTVFGKSMHLYGLYDTKNAIEKNGCAIVVEGQIDCISCHSNGIHNVVALTSSDLSSHQMYLLKKYTKKVFLLLDNDEPGRIAAAKAIKKFKDFIDIEKINIPSPSNDIDDYLLKSAQHNIFEPCLCCKGIDIS